MGVVAKRQDSIRCLSIFSGVELLRFDGFKQSTSEPLERTVRIIDENKDSISQLLRVPNSTFSRLPVGMVLKQFWTSEIAKPYDFEV